MLIRAIEGVSAETCCQKDGVITYENKVAFIASSCERANPEMRKRAHSIRLVDVKLALMLDTSHARSQENLQAVEAWWNLRNDMLTEQSEECVGFLYDRLRAFRR